MALWLPQRRDVITFAGVFGLLGAVYLLPPDTSLRQVRAAGALRVCLPPSYPPLVTGDPAARSFLDTTPAYATTGWAWFSPHPGAELHGRRVGVLVGVSGLDRVALAAWLRAAKAQVTVTLDATELVQGLKDGRFDVGVTERLLAAELATPLGWSVGWMPVEIDRYPVVLGLWKGDLTLKRAIVFAMRRMERSGAMATIMARYIPGASNQAPE